MLIIFSGSDEITPAYVIMQWSGNNLSAYCACTVVRSHSCFHSHSKVCNGLVTRGHGSHVENSKASNRNLREAVDCETNIAN